MKAAVTIVVNSGSVFEYLSRIINEAADIKDVDCARAAMHGRRMNCFARHSAVLERDLTVTVPIVKYYISAFRSRRADNERGRTYIYRPVPEYYGRRNTDIAVIEDDARALQQPEALIVKALSRS